VCDICRRVGCPYDTCIYIHACRRRVYIILLYIHRNTAICGLSLGGGSGVTYARRSLECEYHIIIYNTLALPYDRLENATARRKNNMTTCCRDYILFGRFSTIIFDDARTVAAARGMMIIRFFPLEIDTLFCPGK